MLVTCTTKINIPMDAAAVELESLMNIDIFDSDENDGSYECDADYSEESSLLVSTRIQAIDDGNIPQLLAKHDTLSEEFIFAATYPSPKEDNALLTFLLSSMKDIWTQPQWEACLDNLCCEVVFRRAVLKIVKFFEEELNNCRVQTTVLHQTGQMSYSTLVSLVPLIIPPVLKLLRFVHALWADEVVVRLPKELKEATRFYGGEQFHCIGGKTLKHGDVDEENDLGKWLQKIRESGYKFLGLCAHIKGAFSELLDISSINEAILENMRSMKFWHLTRLIDLVIIPFAKHCPSNLREECVLKLLLPVISFCEEMLRYSWLGLLNTGQANVHYLCVSEEMIKRIENDLLLDLTRKVCKLLGALSSPELNDGLLHWNLNSAQDLITASCKLKCTHTIVGYILLNDCFKCLSMDLFGWWVDGEATIDAIPFCNALVQVAVATNNGKLRRFVEDEMLRALIRRLHDGLPCMLQQTISKLSDQTDFYKEKAKNGLLVLCKNIYTLCIQSQDFEGEGPDNGNKAYKFDDWFAKQKEDLSVKAHCLAPEEFPTESWNWEFEEEFQRYLPIYIDMLHEVNAMDDCLKYGYSREAIFEQLSPAFRARHAISSCNNHLVRQIYKILGRKLSAAYWEQRSAQMVLWLNELITTEPYIEVTDSLETVMDHLSANFDIDLNTFGFDMEYAADVMFIKSLLFFWEPKFHPLIREGQKNILIEIARQLVLAEQSKCYMPLEPDVEDFMYHLQPYAYSYIYRKKKESGYFKAREQVKLHEKFDNYLSSGKLDDDIKEFSPKQDDFVTIIVDKHNVKSEFAELDVELIKDSLTQRATILERQRQIDAYAECLRNALTNEEMKDCLKELMTKLDLKGFLDVNNNSIIWDASLEELVGSFEKLVFTVHGFPRYLVIQGIMDYWEISQQSGIPWQDCFTEVVEVVSHRWRKELEQVWMDTRYYEGLYYDLLRQPLKKIFPRPSH